MQGCRGAADDIALPDVVVLDGSVAGFPQFRRAGVRLIVKACRASSLGRLRSSASSRSEMPVGLWISGNLTCKTCREPVTH